MVATGIIRPEFECYGHHRHFSPPPSRVIGPVFVESQGQKTSAILIEIQPTKETVMKKVLFATAAATMFVAISPAFAASPADDAEWDRRAYPLAGECHFVKQPVMLPNGHLVFQTEQVCS